MSKVAERKSRRAPIRRAPQRKSSGKDAPPSHNEWFELRRSAIAGLGAFAIRDIPKGTRIIEYTGERISSAEADRRYDDDTMEQHHTFLFIVSSRTVVDAAVNGNAARFINHSCDPNCETFVERGRIWIYSMKRIPKGAELTYDYQYDDDPEYTEKDLRFYACRCGSPKCRGTIVKVNPRRRVRSKS